MGQFINYNYFESAGLRGRNIFLVTTYITIQCCTRHGTNTNLICLIVYATATSISGNTSRISETGKKTNICIKRGNNKKRTILDKKLSTTSVQIFHGTTY